MVLTVALFLAAASPLAAQTETTGAITGQVTDESGAVLPGVAITATSPSLQVREVNTLSDERGEYRLTALPIGTYDVTYSLDGFQTVRREGLRLTAGFTARVDLPLKVGSLNESVTVSGASPVVDLSSTSTRTEFTRETLDMIPTSRNGAQSILAQTPGVRSNLDIGGTTAGSVPQYSSFGQAGEPWATVEGVMVASPKSVNQAGNYQDFSTMEEVQVRTMGNDAESPARGIFQAVVMKSGGNAFHGGGFFAYTNEALNGNNIDAALAAQGIRSGSPIVSRWDASIDGGGRIIRDKLWFYAAGRKRKFESEAFNSFKPDGSVATEKADQDFQTYKLSYQPSRTNRLIAFYQWNQKVTIGGGSELSPWETRATIDQPGVTYKGEWQAIGQAVVASVQYGYWDWLGSRWGHTPGKLPTYDIRTQRTTGMSINTLFEQGEFRRHLRGSLSWYRPDMFWGNHEIKTGLDYMQMGTQWDFFERTSSGEYDYHLLFNNGVPFQIVTYNTPVTPVTLVRYSGVYVKDSWAINRRLTLNLGLRFAHDNAFVPEQSRVAGPFAAAETFERIPFNVWNSFAPRVHFAYDLTGDARSVVKGGWGRFDHMRGVEEHSAANRNARTYATYVWHDLNGNRLYEPGEVNLNPNGPDFVNLAAGPTPGYAPSGSGSLSGQVPFADELEPKVDELSLSFERELMPDFGVRVSGIYSREFNVRRYLNVLRPYEAYSIAITNPDPGPDGVLRTGDDPGTLVTYYEYPVALRGVQFQRPMLVNDPKADKSWASFEVAASKRLSNRWQFTASYSMTRINDPLITNLGGGQEYAANTVDPNSEINAANHNWEWLAKASAAYRLPWDLVVAANFEHRSGELWTRDVLFTGGTTIPSISLRVEPYGSRRRPNLNLLDFRLEKGIRLSSHRVAVRVDFFNMLNINSVTGLTTRSGARFGVPTAIVPPRNVAVGASYTF